MSRGLVHHAKFGFCGRTIAARGLIRDMRAWSTVYFADCRLMEFLVGTRGFVNKGTFRSEYTTECSSRPPARMTHEQGPDLRL
jgi:hypothetical protein